MSAHLVRAPLGERTIEGSDILVAAGRTPNTEGIGLEEAGIELTDRGYIRVNERLETTAPNSWAIGDCAQVPDPAGGFAPPTAQHGIRQAKVAARNVAAELGIGQLRPYRYSSPTAFVNLGRYKAVASLGKAQGGKTLSGFPAWWAARTYHVSQIPGFARKLRAVADWTIGLPFRRDTAEVGSIGHPAPLTTEVYARGGSHRPLGTTESGVQ